MITNNNTSISDTSHIRNSYNTNISQTAIEIIITSTNIVLVIVLLILLN